MNGITQAYLNTLTLTKKIEFLISLFERAIP